MTIYTISLLNRLSENVKLKLPASRCDEDLRLASPFSESKTPAWLPDWPHLLFALIIVFIIIIIPS